MRTRFGRLAVGPIALCLAASVVIGLAQAGPVLAQDATPGTITEPFVSDYPARYHAGRPGGTVVVGDWQGAYNLQPYLATDIVQLEVASATNARLVITDDEGRYLPGLATNVPTTTNGGVEIAADGSAIVRWRLRDALLWSDGKGLTCDDFAYTADWLRDVPNPTGNLVGLEVECISPVDMTWRLAHPTSSYLTLIPWPLPRHYLEAIPIGDQASGSGYALADAPRVPVSGPFRFAKASERGLDLVRNDRYVDPVTGRTAYLDRLTFRWYRDPDVMVAAFQAKKPAIDVGLDLVASEVKARKLAKGVLAFPSGIYVELVPNLQERVCDPVLQVERSGLCPLSLDPLRVAIARAVDPVAIAAAVGGTPIASFSDISPTAWWRTQSTALPPDLTAAGEALDAAGWPREGVDGLRFRDVDADGARDPGEAQLVLAACTTGNTLRGMALHLVAEQLGHLGIRLDEVTVDPIVLFGQPGEAPVGSRCALADGSFDLVIMSWTLLSSPADITLDLADVSVNPGRVTDEGLRDASQRAREAMDSAALIAAMADYQAAYQRTVAQVPLLMLDEVILRNPKVSNVTPSVDGILWNVAHWWRR